MKTRMRWWEFGCGCLMCLILAAVFIPPIMGDILNHGKAPVRSACQNNLKQFGIIFKMYANESHGELYPPMMVADLPLIDCDRLPQPLPLPVSNQTARSAKIELPETGQRGIAVAMPLMPVIYPEYLTDPTVLQCPADDSFDMARIQTDAGEPMPHIPCAQPGRGAWASGQSYAYTGYAIQGPDESIVEEQMTSLFRRLQSLLKGNEWKQAEALVNADFPVPIKMADGKNTNAVYRLREGVERFYITDINDPAATTRAQSQIWLLHDVLRDTAEEFSHEPPGCNILYLDGHVDFIRFLDSAEDMPPVSSGVRAAYALLP